MDYIKHLPEDPAVLADLIDYREGRVISMSLSKSDKVQMMLMAVSQGEEVTSEQYPGDTLYLVLDGLMPLHRENGDCEMKAGEIVAIPRGTAHAIGGAGNFKILQMIITE